MSEPARLVFKRTIPASPEEVFEAWTDPELIRQWLAPGENAVIEARTDPRVGGALHIRSISPDGTIHTINGIFREFEPGKRLALTWTYNGPIELICEMATLLQIDLTAAASDGETAMTLTQTEFATSEAAAIYSEGWPTCFDKLQDCADRAKNDHCHSEQ